MSFANTTLSNSIGFNTSAEKSRIGRYVLHYGRMTLDYINQRYAFEKYAKPTPPEISDFGFTVIVRGSKVLAGTVWEGSRAWMMGMYSGYEIIQINNTQFSGLAHCEVEKAIAEIKSKRKFRLSTETKRD